MQPTTLQKYLESFFVGKYIVVYSTPSGIGRTITTKKPKRYGLKRVKPALRYVSKITGFSFSATRIENTKNRCAAYLTIFIENRSIIVQFNDQIQILNENEIQNYIENN